MIHMTYKDIRQPDFGKALRKLAECTDLKTPALLLRIVKAFKTIIESDKACIEVIKKLNEQHGQKQEDGSTKIINLEAYEKDLEELFKTEFTVDIDVLKFNDLLPAKLSAVDVNALGNLISL